MEGATWDLVLAEAESRRRAGLPGAALDSIGDGDGVGVVDEQGAFLIHNPAAEALLGVEDTDGRPTWQEHEGLFTTDGAPFPVDELPMVRAFDGESTDRGPEGCGRGVP